MNAPEVGDRVRVIAGQWTGWEGVICDQFGSGFLRANLTHPQHGGNVWTRVLVPWEVEKVPTTPDSTPQSDTSDDQETNP